MRLLNDHAEQINGDVRFDSFEELDIISLALNDLTKKEAKTPTAKERKEIAEKLLAKFLFLADCLADKYGQETYNQEPKV